MMLSRLVRKGHVRVSSKCRHECARNRGLKRIYHQLTFLVLLLVSTSSHIRKHILLIVNGSMNSKLTGEGEAEVKKIIVIFTYNQCLLSIDMKTKVVQHVLRIIL